MAKLPEEPPFDTRSAYLRASYDLNGWPLIKYHTSLQNICCLSDAAERDGVVLEMTTYPMGVWLKYYFPDGPDGPRTYRFDGRVKLLREFSLEEFNEILSVFERLSPTPEVYFLYNYLKYFIAAHPPLPVPPVVDKWSLISLVAGRHNRQ